MIKKPALKNKPTTKNVALGSSPDKKASPPVKTKPIQAVVKPKPSVEKKLVVKATSKTTNAVKPPIKSVPETKPNTEKVKMERDSFTMPKDEYTQISALKKRLEALGKPAKKSELLRAGLKLLSAMNDAQLQAALAKVPTIKTGRPKK